MSTPPLASSTGDGAPTRELSAQELAAAVFAGPSPTAVPAPAVFDARTTAAPVPAAAPGGFPPVAVPGAPAPVPGAAAAGTGSPFATAGTVVLSRPAPPAFTPSTFGSGAPQSPVAETGVAPLPDSAVSERRRPGPRVLAAGVLGLIAAAALGLVLLTGGGSEEVPLAAVVTAATTAPTTAPAATPTPATDGRPAVGSTRNVFAPLVTADGGADGSGSTAADSASGVVIGTGTGTGATATAPGSGVTIGGGTGTGVAAAPITRTATATATVTARDTGALATTPATALTVLWTGTTTADDVVAQNLTLTTSAGTTTTTAVVGGALGTAAPLSWVVSQGVGADGVLTLVAGTTTYQLTSGVPLALF